MIDPEVMSAFDALPLPDSAQLTPFTVRALEKEPAYAELAFEPQPAFGNHFGDVQGGFAVAFVDAVMAAVIFAETGGFHPSVSIETHYLNRLPIGVIRGEGRILKHGSTIVVAEVGLFAGETLAVRAIGTVVMGRPVSIY